MLQKCLSKYDGGKILILYSTFRAKRAIYGGLTVADTLISYTIIYGFSESLWCEEFREHIRLSKKITREIKVHEDINMECSNPDHWIQQKILPILDYKNSSIRQLFQVLWPFKVFKDNCPKLF